MSQSASSAGVSTTRAPYAASGSAFHAPIHDIADTPADFTVIGPEENVSLGQTLATGDFNSEPGGDTYKAFPRVLQDTRTQVKAPQGPRLTFHDFTGKATVQLLQYYTSADITGDWKNAVGYAALSFEEK